MLGTECASPHSLQIKSTVRHIQLQITGACHAHYVLRECSLPVPNDDGLQGEILPLLRSPPHAHAVLVVPLCAHTLCSLPLWASHLENDDNRATQRRSPGRRLLIFDSHALRTRGPIHPPHPRERGFRAYITSLCCGKRKLSDLKRKLRPSRAPLRPSRTPS